MRLFVTHMPGFTPDTWPVVSFPKAGCVKRLKREIDEAGPETRVLFLGTLGKDTAKHERGRLLGLADVYDQPIYNTEEVIDDCHKWKDEEKTERSNIYSEDGTIRWPTGLAIRRAWFFDQPPNAKEEQFLGKTNERGNREYIDYETGLAWEIWDESRIDNIMALPRSEETLYTDIASEVADWTGLPTGPTYGPPPSTGDKGLQTESQPKAPPVRAYTYVLRFGGSDCYKIGYTTSLRARLTSINAHIPIEILQHDSHWELYLCHTWSGKDCRDLAYLCENLLRNKLLEKRRTRGERVKCPEAELKGAWKTAIAKVESQTP